jgi:hypothetical protein
MDRNHLDLEHREFFSIFEFLIFPPFPPPASPLVSRPTKHNEAMRLTKTNSIDVDLVLPLGRSQVRCPRPRQEVEPTSYVSLLALLSSY